MRNVILGKKFVAGVLLDLAERLIDVVRPEDDIILKEYVQAYGSFLTALAKRELK